MIPLSRITEKVESSKIRKMFNLAQGLEDVISFALGEPDFTASQNVVSAAVKAIEEGNTKYSLNAGIIPLRNSIAKCLKAQFGLDYNPNNEIIVTSGGMQALYMAMMVILNPGDEVIISNPCWTNYPQQVKMCGGKPIFVNIFESDGFVFTCENLSKMISPKTKILIINSPSNPTGAVMDLDCLKMIAKIAIDNDLYVISDEVYKHIIYDDLKHISIASIPGMKERTIVVDSFSKTYAMTGWRVGYAAANIDIIRQMIKFQENIIACVNTPSQYAALEALDGDQSYMHLMLREYATRRDIVFQGINAIKGLSCKKSKGTFYSFINIKSTGLNSEEFAQKLLDKERVVTIPGNAFGESGEGYIRLSYATSAEKIHEGLFRINRFIDSLD